MGSYFARRHPGELLGAFLMNWKGETFYSRNEVVQISAKDPKGELAALALRPGRMFLLVEHGRLGMLQAALPPGKRLELLEKEITNKFALVSLSE